MKENLGSFVAIALSVLLVWVVKPEQVYQPCGVMSAFYPQSTKPVPGKAVREYAEPVFGAQVLGTVHIELSVYAKVHDKKSAMLRYAKELAGRAGANGLFVQYWVRGGKVYRLLAIALNV